MQLDDERRAYYCNDEEDALTEASTVVGEEDLSSAQAASRSPQRVHWLVAYHGCRPTLVTLCDAGLAVDGCHSTVSDGEGVLYLHMSSRCRQMTVVRCLGRLRCAVIRVVDCANDKIMAATAEFLLLVRQMNAGDPRFVSEGLGLLAKHTAGKAPSLEQRVAFLERERVLTEERLQQALADRKRLEGEMGSLASERAEQESELKRLRIENSEFRRLGAEAKEVRGLNREVMTLREDLDAKSQDCRVLEAMLRVAREDTGRLREAALNRPRNYDYSKTFYFFCPCCLIFGFDFV